MERLESLERATEGIKYQLLSFESLEYKSPQLQNTLHMIRSILQLENKEEDPKHTDTDQTQKLFKILTKIVTFLFNESEPTASINTPINTPINTGNDYNAKCICLLKSQIHFILSNSSAMAKYFGASSKSVAGTKPHLVPKRRIKPLCLKNDEIDKNCLFDDESLQTKILKLQHLNTSTINSRRKAVPILPSEEALKTDLILHQIFHHSSPSDLKEFRLVNWKWNDMATLALLSKRVLQISLSVPNAFMTASAIRVFENRSRPIGSLKDLSMIIILSKKFPTNSIYINGNNFHEDEGVKQLFRKHGHLFKEIKLKFWPSLPYSFLLNLLRNETPNVDTLHVLGKLDFKLQDKIHYCSPLDLDFDLSNLKQLTYKFYPFNAYYETDLQYRNNVNFFTKLLELATNLTSIETNVFDFLEKAVKSNKGALIKALKYEPFQLDKEDHSVIPVYEKLACTRSQLTLSKLKIVLRFGDVKADLYPFAFDVERATTVLNSLLETSKNSLRFITMDPLGKLPGIILPRLPKVKRISVLKGREPEEEDELEGCQIFSLFPPAFSFSNHLPNLTDVDLMRLYNHKTPENFSAAFISAYFPENQITTICYSVQTLTVPHTLYNLTENEVEGAKRIAKIFPNITSLKVKGAFYNSQVQIYELNSILWHFCPDTLKSLEIHGIALSRGLGKPVMDFVDTFFTGIPLAKLDAIRRPSMGYVGLKTLSNAADCKVDVERTERSICDLKHLQELNLFCRDFRLNYPIASRVTGIYGFGMLPKLKVNVIYHLQHMNPTEEGKHTPLTDISRCVSCIAPYIDNFYYR